MNRFEHSDGWLLVSILYCAKKANLDDIIAKGDMINHAIFTLKEINEGLSRLVNEGFIEVNDKKIILTREAKTFDKKNKKLFENFIDKQLRYSNILQRTEIQNEVVYRDYFNENEYNEAIKKNEKYFSSLMCL